MRERVKGKNAEDREGRCLNNSVEGFVVGTPVTDLNLHRSVLPKPADPQIYADMQKVTQVPCSHAGSSHSVTICGVNGPQGKKQGTVKRTRAGSQKSSARFKCVLLGGVLITLPMERKVGLAPGSLYVSKIIGI